MADKYAIRVNLLKDMALIDIKLIKLEDEYRTKILKLKDEKRSKAQSLYLINKKIGGN